MKFGWKLGKIIPRRTLPLNFGFLQGQLDVVYPQQRTPDFTKCRIQDPPHLKTSSEQRTPILSEAHVGSTKKYITDCAVLQENISKNNQMKEITIDLPKRYFDYQERNKTYKGLFRMSGVLCSKNSVQQLKEEELCPYFSLHLAQYRYPREHVYFENGCVEEPLMGVDFS